MREIESKSYPTFLLFGSDKKKKKKTNFCFIDIWSVYQHIQTQANTDISLAPKEAHVARINQTTRLKSILKNK